MKRLLLLAFVFVLLSFNESRKKKKKQRAPKQPENPLDRRPSKIKPELYCDACIAMIRESVKELRGKKKQSDVVSVVEDICNPEKYYTYRKY